MSVDYAQIYWKQVQELQSKLELMQMKASDLSVLCDRLEAKNKIMREALESMLICANAVDPRFSYKRVAKRALAAVEKLEKE